MYWMGIRVPKTHLQENQVVDTAKSSTKSEKARQLQGWILTSPHLQLQGSYFVNFFNKKKLLLYFTQYQQGSMQ